MVDSPHMVLEWTDFESTLIIHEFVLNVFFSMMEELQIGKENEALRGWGVLLFDQNGVVLARQGSQEWRSRMASLGVIPGVQIQSRDLAGLPHRCVDLTDGEKSYRVILALTTERVSGDGSLHGTAPAILSLLSSLFVRQAQVIRQEKELRETPFELQKLNAFYRMVVATEGTRVTTQELLQQSLDFVRLIIQVDRVGLVFPQARRDLFTGSHGLGSEISQLPRMKRLFSEKRPIRVSRQDHKPEAAALLEVLDAAAVMAIPILFESGQCGAALVATRNQCIPFTEQDAELVAFIALQIGLALENTDLREQLQKKLDDLTEELQLARSMQQAILPSEPIQVPDVEIFGFTQPSRLVGGDFFDYWRLTDGSYIGVVGDIMGKGVGAALLMSFLRAHVHTVISGHQFGPSVLEHLSRDTWSEFSRARVLATLSLFRFQPSTNRLTLLIAGHHPPLRFRSGRWQVLEAGRGVALGLTGSPTYQNATTDHVLKPGDILIFCSDGLMEFAQTKRDRLRVQGLLDISKAISPRGAIDAVTQLRTHLDDILQSDAPKDDVTVLAVSVPDRKRT